MVPKIEDGNNFGVGIQVILQVYINTVELGKYDLEIDFG